MSKTVPSNNQIPRDIRQGIRNQRTSHTESPSLLFYASSVFVNNSVTNLTPVHALMSCFLVSVGVVFPL